MPSQRRRRGASWVERAARACASRPPPSWWVKARRIEDAVRGWEGRRRGWVVGDQGRVRRN